MKKISFIDLFAGIGGFRLALEKFNFKCLFSSEIDDSCREVYKENFGSTPKGDIRKILSKDIPKHDLLVAGFPCQPFSRGGKNLGFKDERGNVFFEIVRILRDRKSDFFLLENVKGLRGENLDLVINTLVNLGYFVRVSQLNSKDFGLPQSRERIFIFGSRKIINFNFPIKTKIKTRIGDILFQRTGQKYTISDKLWISHQARKKRNKQRGVGFGYSKVSRNDEYTRTLSSRYYKDGSEILIDQKNKNPRMLTPRECARLQGFPESFKIHTSNIEAYKQFGNAVSVPVVEAIVREFLKSQNIKSS
tara:strand:- start:8816 stop:9730 length:915 start_codon:yes stop_codon:yes gene_type:complete